MYEVAKEMFGSKGFKEPMPDFRSRFPGKLESSLETPFGRYGKTHFYRGLTKKAMALFYLCIKNHPFENGNKRVAVTALLYFLAKNGYWVRIDPVDLYKIAREIAKLPQGIRPEVVINELSRVFKDRIFDVSEHGVKPLKIPKILEQKDPINLRIKT